MEGQIVQNPTSEPILTPVQVPEPKAKFPVIYLILSLLILVFLASTAFLFYQNMQLKNMLASYQTQPTVSPTATTYQSPVPTTDLTANWKTYTNNYWKISFKYPDTLLKSCPNYLTEKEGIGFWESDFTCPDGHDVFPEIGLTGYDLGKYTESKTPSKTETIIIDGKQEQKKTYLYNESDGPAAGLKQSINVVIALPNGTIVMYQLGDDVTKQKLFDQILSTFKFTN